MTSQPADKGNKPASPAKKPGGLLDQYHLLGAIIDTSWATRLDHKVARHIIDRYYPKHGNGRASLRYLERATGGSRSNIVASLRRLAEQGAIALVRQGQGTRPSEFSLNFHFPASVPTGVTAGSDDPGGTAGVTSCGHVGDTSSGASVPTGVTESYLRVPAYKAGVPIDRNDTRPPTAPPLADGLAATAAGGAAVEEEECVADKPTFELLWRTYDYAKGKKEARVAWNALPPDTDLAAVIEAARAWQQSWAAQGKPDAPRFTLARWLKDERYDEDAPRGFQRTERMAKAKAVTSSKTKPAKPFGPVTLRITSADVVTVCGITELRLATTDGDDVVSEHVIPIEHDDARLQEEGQKQLASLVHAAGLNQIADSTELLGRTIVLTEEGRFTAPTLWTDEEPEPHSSPRLDELNAAAKADFDAWFEADHDEAA